MSDIIAAVAKDVPILALFAASFWLFLKHLGKRDDKLKDINEECHRVQRDVIEAMRENSRVIGQLGKDDNAHMKMLHELLMVNSSMAESLTSIEKGLTQQALTLQKVLFVSQKQVD